MRTDPLLILLLLVLIPGTTTVCSGGEGINSIGDRAYDRILSFEADQKIFPDSWTKAPFHVTAKEISGEQKRRGRRLVRQAVSRYPSELISQTLDHIYLVGEIEVYEKQHFAGTAHQNAVYLVVKRKKEGFTNQFIRRNFHREFSTTLLNRHLESFDRVAWKQVNGSSFSYLGTSSWKEQDVERKGGGKQAIATGRTSLELTTNDELLQRGLLTEYSRSSIENDFNEYAARLFSGSSSFWKRVEAHSGVHQKMSLTVAFYRRVHPDLTKAYIRHLAKK